MSNSRRLRTLTLAAVLSAGLSPLAGAQLADHRVVTLEAAKKMLGAAEAEARRNNWPVAIAVVDAAGDLVAFSKLDETQAASIDIAIGKARTAVRFKRPTKALEDAVAAGRSVLIAVPGIMPLEGGLPIIVNSKIVGGIGVSGVMSQQDAQVAKAGADALVGQ